MRDDSSGPRADGREASHPPSEPHPSFSRSRPPLPVTPLEDRPVRVQLVVALVLGLVLVATGLLWRRPRASAEGAAAEGATLADAGAPDEGGSALAAVDAAPPPVSLSEVRVVGCHDRGARVTAPEDCDHLATVEQALSHAIEESVACYPATLDSATIEYLADVSFSRHRLRVSLPRSGRSTHDRKVVSACAAAVRESMHVELDRIDHRHARYEITITATYKGKG
jgi:hypothetical protein